MKIGVLGTGRIAHKVCLTLKAMEEIECYAVASRTLEKAKTFCTELGFQKAYGSYVQMLEDPDVELVYVTTPHSEHYENIMLCMKYGKSVICEKAFTLNAEQAKKIRDYSREHKIFVAEAIWTRYMPSRQIIADTVNSGVIGDVKALTANLFYNVSYKERLIQPSLGGGALLDVGVYCINFALMNFGHDIKKIESSVQMTKLGVDANNFMTFFYEDGRLADLSSGMLSISDRRGVIYGTKGYAVVENINNPQSISVYDDSHNLISRTEMPVQISGYEYEFRECVKAIEEGRTESWSMPINETVRVMEIMDSLRKDWGFKFPKE
ncbi:MAG: Gfo/Idh/MocA family oxidoreductase [Sphaerochaetaceae bacterium]|nr:Gfo/Idh/MocA family oxidoreductase [Sphaerochaetaceae bacterium]